MHKPVIERFESRYVPEPNSGCWLWTGTIDARGYGRLSVKRKNPRAHRLSYQMFVGPIPDGLVLDHLCRVRSCVNPAHLEPVTIAENLRRGLTRFAAMQRRWKATHCRHGHPFSEENTYFYASGARACKTCTKASHEKSRQRRELAGGATAPDRFEIARLIAEREIETVANRTKEKTNDV